MRTAPSPRPVSNDPPLLLRFESFELDEAQVRLTRDGVPLALPPKAFAVLCALLRRPGQLVRKDDLLDAVWGHRHVSDSVLKSAVSELRAALGDDPRQPRCIETASRHGYRLIAPVRPLAAAAAAGMRDPAAAAPPPAALIGRRPALERLRAAWERACEGRRQLVWVAGEAGIGKTTLIDHAVAGFAATTARGQCVEQQGAGEPYGPLLEALAALCRVQPDLPPLLRQVAPSWWVQMPWLGTDPEADALRLQLAGGGHPRMLREFGELLARWTEARPLVLVTEDLHWSDAATLRLLDHVARGRGPARLLWLASFRPAEVVAQDGHPLKALRHELRLHRLVDEIGLDPFSEREVGDYLAGRLPGAEDADALARDLHARTDGLPLFVSSVVDEWVGGAGPGDLPDDGTAPVPESLAGVVGRQIERLAPDERELLEAAAVCGVEFRLGTLADVLARDLQWVAARCDALVQRQCGLGNTTVQVSPDGAIDLRCAFRHALVRQVMLQRLGTLQRVQLHRRVAASLAGARGVSAAELALHHEGGHDWPAALQCHAAAAGDALRRFAPEEAVAVTGHALALLPRCPEGIERDRLELALLAPRMTAAQLLSPTGSALRETLDRVQLLHRRLPDPTSGFDIELAWLDVVGGRYADALPVAERVHAAAAAADVPPVRHVAACNLLGTTLLHLGRLVESRARLEEGLQAAAGLGDWPAQALAVVDLEVSLRCRLGQALSHLGLHDDAIAMLDAADRRARRFGPYTRRLALIHAGLLAIRLGQPARVLEIAESLQRLAGELPPGQAGGPAQWLRGWASAQLGDPLAGHADIVAGDAEEQRLGFERGRSGVLGLAADALLRAARWDDAQRQLDAAFELAARTGERLHLPTLWRLRAGAWQGLAEPARADEALEASALEAERQICSLPR